MVARISFSEKVFALSRYMCYAGGKAAAKWADGGRGTESAEIRGPSLYKENPVDRLNLSGTFGAWVLLEPATIEWGKYHDGKKKEKKVILWKSD